MFTKRIGIGIGILIAGLFVLGIGIGIKFTNSQIDANSFIILGLALNSVGLFTMIMANKKD